MIPTIRLLARAIKYRYKLDPAELAFVLSAVRRGQTVLDLGAHKGGYTWWLARAVGRSGRVVCVEPQRNLADALKSVMANRPQVHVEWAAVSETTGTGRLSLRADGSSHGASIVGFDGEEGKKARTVEVPTVTLADLAQRHSLGRIDFIKCDIEGHEGAVFAAASALIERDRPTILVECEERHASGPHAGVSGLVRLFEPMGYRIRFFHSGRLHAVETFDASKHQTYGQGEYANNFVLEPQ